jgi:hypothetical protein
MFVYQGNGNLVLYHGGAPLWASGTEGRPVGVCIMQGDGNLVIYVRGGEPIWASGTEGHPGSRLIVQDDGNVVIYRPDGTPVGDEHRARLGWRKVAIPLVIGRSGGRAPTAPPRSSSGSRHPRTEIGLNGTINDAPVASIPNVF